MLLIYFCLTVRDEIILSKKKLRLDENLMALSHDVIRAIPICERGGGGCTCTTRVHNNLRA